MSDNSFEDYSDEFIDYDDIELDDNTDPIGGKFAYFY
jgi:hypothetical protein